MDPGATLVGKSINPSTAPLGQGEVDVTAIVDALEGSGNDLMIMAELDLSEEMPLEPCEAARINKAYLQKIGYSFRS